MNTIKKILFDLIGVIRSMLVAYLALVKKTLKIGIIKNIARDPKPKQEPSRLLPMPLILVILSSFFPMSIGLNNPIKIEPQVRIVNTLELLALIKTEDDTIRLFNFWATWCQPCVRELPHFVQLNSLKKTEKFRMYLVSLDIKNTYKKHLIPFLKKKGIESTVLLFDGGNPNDWIDKINPDWSGAIPASLIAYKGQNCFEENSFEDLNALSNFMNHCKTIFKL